MGIKDFLLKSFVRTCHVLGGVNNRKVLFTSFQGRNYSDNPRAISEALHAMDKSIEIVWLINNPHTKEGIIPQYVRCVDTRNRKKMYRELATAKVFLSNFSFWKIPKSKKQMFVQTWHGDKAFKTVLYDSPLYKHNHVFAESIPEYCDLAIAGSEYGKRQYESAFRYKGKILMEGTPRNDRLVQSDPKLREELKHALSISENTRILLFAPTLRNAQSGTSNAQPVQNINMVSVLNQLEKKDNCQWVCFLRAHPTIAGLTGTGEDSRIVDMSGYEDMADLLLISDMLITDYSSCAGDFALLRRPLVLFQADREEYLEKDRTFYFDIDESPYYVARSQGELERIITEITAEKAAANCEEILKFYGDCETGHAAESVARIIKEWIEK